MNVDELIINKLAAALKMNQSDIGLDVPESMHFGDYSSNVAMKIIADKKEVFRQPHDNKVESKILSTLSNTNSPRELAEKIAEKLHADKNISAFVDKIEIAGPGFINFFLSHKYLTENLRKVIEQNDRYGTSELGKGQKVVIDYSAPNIAKRFSIGHLRSTIIGQALYNIYKFLGYEVIGDNHLGDWGTQFGKLLYMLDREKVNNFDIDKLEDLYVRFHEEGEKNPQMEEEARRWFKRLEGGDQRARELWQKCKDVSLAEFNNIYSRLGIEIDYAYGESFYEDRMKDLISRFEKGELKGLEVGEGGAKVINLEEFGIRVPLMFIKKDGTTTYATRDLATIDFRCDKWDPTMMVYEVGAEQTLHFQQVFASSRKLGLVEDSTVLYHTRHGLYLSPDGKKFRTRSGGTVKLEKVLDEAVSIAENIITKSETVRNIEPEKVKDLAEIVGIGAIKYFDLLHSPQSDIVFDWKKVVNMEGNSGPYLQYTYARTQSVLDKANKNYQLGIKNYKLNEAELQILRVLVHFPETVQEAGKKYSPNLICNYLYDLAQKFNSFYNGNKIIGSDNEELRLALSAAVGTVLRNGLKLLGIEAPVRM